MSRPALFALLMVFGVLWGGTIPLTKLAVTEGNAPLGLIAWQLSFSALLLGCLVLIRRSSVPLSARHLAFYAVVAALGTLVPNFFSYYAAAQLPAGVMALVIALVPMFALAVAVMFRLERPDGKRFLGVLLGATAIALIVLPQSSLPDPTKAWVVLVALIAPFCYGVEGNYLSVNQPKDVGPIGTLFGASVVGALVSVPAAWITGLAVPVDKVLQFRTPELALFGSALLHVVAYAGYIWLVKRAGPVFTAQVAYVVTPAGVLLAMVFLGERPATTLWLALVVLLIGLSLVQPKDQDAQKGQAAKEGGPDHKPATTPSAPLAQPVPREPS
ncbi:MAG: DMT family transporter [Pseudomonadota bacterium]